MSDDVEEEEEECTYAEDGECDGMHCREPYYVEVTRTIRFTVLAHDEDEAADVASNEMLTSQTEPRDWRVEDGSFEDDGEEVTVESDAERREAAARQRAYIEQWEREHQDEGSSATT